MSDGAGPIIWLGVERLRRRVSGPSYMVGSSRGLDLVLAWRRPPICGVLDDLGDEVLQECWR